MNKYLETPGGDSASTAGCSRSAEQPEELTLPVMMFRPSRSDLMTNAYLITHPWINLQEWLEGQTR